MNIIKKQIGCGYCISKKNCEEREPKINKAKKGCKKYIHYLTQKLN